MKRIVTVIVLAVGGLVAATALTLSALALAGGDIGDVVRPRLDEQGTTQTRSVTNTPSPNDDGSPSETPSADDHSSASEPGDDHGGDGDNSGSGSDNSGSGSDNSGSGSDNSGSGSGSDDD